MRRIHFLQFSRNRLRTQARYLSCNILVLNCGSSSIKYQVIDPISKDILLKGSTDRLNETIYQQSIEKIFHLVDNSGISLSAIGHRWVNGGKYFSKPILVTDQMISQLQEIIPLAPLHNPHNFRGILTGKEINPSLPNVVVFDTAFHQSIRDTVYLYPIPLEYSLKYHLRKYGFHGISYQYISSALYDHLSLRSSEQTTTTHNIGIYHLGSGCSAAVISLCVDPKASFQKNSAVCHDTTMGFTPLDGLMMGTRSGSIDPSLVSFLSQNPEEMMSLDEVMTMLNKKSGLLGVSGMTQDVRDLLHFIQTQQPGSSSSCSSSSSSSCYSEYERAVLSIDMFCHRAAREMLGLTAALPSPLDALVFTGGIGEKSALIRSKILSHMKSLGTIQVNEDLNLQNSFQITEHHQEDGNGSSSVKVFVIPTNEELQIAIETAELINLTSAPPNSSS